MSSKEILPSEFLEGIKSGKYGKNAIIKYCETLLDLEEFWIDLIVEQSKLIDKYNKPIIAIKGDSVSLTESMPKSAKMEYERLSVAIHTIETMMKKSQHYPNDKQPAFAQQLPDKLNTDEAKRYFAKAIELGLMTDNYKWLKGLQMLACFARDFSMKLSLGKGNRISWKPFESLFGIEPGKLRLNYNDIQKTGQNPSESGLIDKVFE